jgi:hypothetical protein
MTANRVKARIFVCGIFQMRSPATKQLGTAIGVPSIVDLARSAAVAAVASIIPAMIATVIAVITVITGDCHHGKSWRVLRMYRSIFVAAFMVLVPVIVTCFIPRKLDQVR